MKEIELTKIIQLELSHGPTRLFRNNIGSLKDATGRWVKFGVANPGGSDLIGWTTVEITPEMVGRKVAVFTAIETKGERTRTTAEQVYFVQAVRAAGGFAGIAKTVEEAVNIFHV